MGGSIQFTIIIVTFSVAFFLILYNVATVVPQRYEIIVERLGKYHRTLSAGFHLLLPFVDRKVIKVSLREEVISIEQQTSITKDNVQLGIDGVLYLQVIDSKLSYYGITSYKFASTQLAQTTLRAVIGKLTFDKTFEERESLNRAVVAAVDEAAQNWGVKVLRYEVKDINVDQGIMDAMEIQMKAERKKRAEVATSEGARQSTINIAEGEKQNAILTSEGEKQKVINAAEAQATKIRLEAEATAEAISKVAESLSLKGGSEAANLEVAKEYIKAFEKLAKENNTLIIPSDVNNVSSMIATAMSVIDKTKK